MKDIRSDLLALIKQGYCTPLISQIAKKTNNPSSTIHYNIKRLEEQRVITHYRAVINHKQAGDEFCAFVLLNLSSKEYADPEVIAKELAKHDEIHDVHICTGDWEVALKVRTKNMDAYYELVKRVLSRPGIERIKTLSSMKEIKDEGVQTDINKRQ